MSSYTYQIEGGGVLLNVTVTETNGGLQFDLAVDESTGTTADLNAFYLDIADGNLVDGLSVEGDHVTGTKFDEDSVTKIDNFTNMNGDAIKEAGKFDFGIQFGTQGIGEDDIQSTSFFLSHGTEVLTIEDFLGMDNGVRLTSVGDVDGSRDGSLKLVGTVDPVEVVDEEPVIVEDPVVGEEPVVVEDPVIIEDPVVGEEPVVVEDPVIVEEPVVGEEPVVVEDPVIVEEPVVGEEPVVVEDPVIIEEPVVEEDPVIVDGGPLEGEEFVFEYDGATSEEIISWEEPVEVITPEEDIFPPMDSELSDEAFLAEISLPLDESFEGDVIAEEPVDDSEWALF